MNGMELAIQSGVHRHQGSPALQSGKSAPYFNTGVAVMDLEKLSRLKFHRRISELIDHHTNIQPLWKHGVQQPSFVLALYPYIQ
eukprot:scaffold266041_cov43-Prasinocladus_malaysianus.AAC.1